MKPSTHARITAHAVDIAMRYADARDKEDALIAAARSATAEREAIEAEWRAMTAPDWAGKL